MRARSGWGSGHVFGVLCRSTEALRAFTDLSFINQGFEFGGQATAAAKVNEDGGARQGAISVKEGVWIYQLTDQGVALELTLKGTKYYKNKQLN